jgi:hypothetical protein
MKLGFKPQIISPYNSNHLWSGHMFIFENKATESSEVAVVCISCCTFKHSSFELFLNVADEGVLQYVSAQ